MGNRASDISLINKYLAGQLDAKAMHQLERRALDDPFLMDALEGYQNTLNDQQGNLDELSARLANRTAAKRGTIISWNVIGIAASVLIVCSAGIWWLSGRNAEKAKRISPAAIALSAQGQPKADSTTKASAPAASAEARVSQKAIAKNAAHVVAADKMVSEVPIDEAVASVNPTIKDSVKKDTMPLNEMIVMGYTKKLKSDTVEYKANKYGYAEKKPVDTSLFMRKAPVVTKVSPQPNNIRLLKGQADGAADNNQPSPSPPKDVTLNGTTIKANDLAAMPMNTYKEYSKDIIQGTVVSGQDGAPIPGASVHIAGTNKTTTTDNNGYFALPADSGKATLVVNSIGYQAAKTTASNRDSVKTIPLTANTNSLAEVVVTKPNTHKHTGASLANAARPQAGWGSYRDYLEKTAVSPDGKSGVVTLSFTVGGDGMLSEIKITDGISPATDAVAIGLVKNGPKWLGNLNGQPEKVTLKIRFR